MDDELIQVFVPRKHVLAVYQFIAGLDTVETKHIWTEANIVELIARVSATGLSFLYALSLYPDEDLTIKQIHEIISRSGGPILQLQGYTGALVRAVHNLGKDSPILKTRQRSGGTTYKLRGNFASLFRPTYESYLATIGGFS